MVILVHGALYYTACDESYVLYLGTEVQGSVLNLLYHIGQTVGAVYIHELGLLVDVCLVTLRTHQVPELGQLAGQSYHCSRLYVKVTCIIPRAHCQAGDMLVGFVFGVCGVTHAVTVLLLIVGGCLDGIIHM